MSYCLQPRSTRAVRATRIVDSALRAGARASEQKEMMKIWSSSVSTILIGPVAGIAWFSSYFSAGWWVADHKKAKETPWLVSCADAILRGGPARTNAFLAVVQLCGGKPQLWICVLSWVFAATLSYLRTEKFQANQHVYLHDFAKFCDMLLRGGARGNAALELAKVSGMPHEDWQEIIFGLPAVVGMISSLKTAKWWNRRPILVHDKKELEEKLSPSPVMLMLDNVLRGGIGRASLLWMIFSWLVEQIFDVEPGFKDHPGMWWAVACSVLLISVVGSYASYARAVAHLACTIEDAEVQGRMQRLLDDDPLGATPFLDRTEALYKNPMAEEKVAVIVPYVPPSALTPAFCVKTQEETKEQEEDVLSQTLSQPSTQ